MYQLYINYENYKIEKILKVNDNQKKLNVNSNNLELKKNSLYKINSLFE